MGLGRQDTAREWKTTGVWCLLLQHACNARQGEAGSEVGGVSISCARWEKLTFILSATVSKTPYFPLLFNFLNHIHVISVALCLILKSFFTYSV